MPFTNTYCLCLIFFFVAGCSQESKNTDIEAEIPTTEIKQQGIKKEKNLYTLQSSQGFFDIKLQAISGAPAIGEYQKWI